MTRALRPRPGLNQRDLHAFAKLPQQPVKPRVSMRVAKDAWDASEQGARVRALSFLGASPALSRFSYLGLDYAIRKRLAETMEAWT